jgi:thiol:disulfide interchange protein
LLLLQQFADDFLRELFVAHAKRSIQQSTNQKRNSVREKSRFSRLNERDNNIVNERMAIAHQYKTSSARRRIEMSPSLSMPSTVSTCLRSVACRHFVRSVGRSVGRNEKNKTKKKKKNKVNVRFTAECVLDWITQTDDRGRDVTTQQQQQQQTNKQAHLFNADVGDERERIERQIAHVARLSR